MLHAIEVPVLKLAAVAGLALGVTALVPHPARHVCTTPAASPHHLTLHAPVNPVDTYWSVFANGPVDLMLPEGPFQIEVIGRYVDGCD